VTGNAVVDNASIVERSGSTYNGTTTPTEILFSSSSGFTATAGGADVVSDELEFDIDETKDYLLTLDYADSGTVWGRAKSSGGNNCYRAGTNAYNQQDFPTGYKESTSTSTYTILISKIEVRSIVYPTDTIYITTTPGANTSEWQDINSATVTETLNSQTHYYSVTFDGGTTWGIFDDEAGDAGWRPIARDNSGTWQYNSNTTAGANDVTWTNATIDSQEGALSQAMGVAQNQMTDITSTYISDENWDTIDGAMNGFQAGTTTSLSFAIGQISTSSSATPTLSQITVNYLASEYWEPLDMHGSNWDMQYYPDSTVLTKTGTGTDNVKVHVSI
jgi:hypothetical protein